MASTFIDPLSANTIKQSLESTHPPPIDGRLVVDQLYDWHRAKSGGLPCLVWAKENLEKGSMTWEELGRGVDRATALIENEIKKAMLSESFSANDLPSTNDFTKPIVVGILSNTDSVTYSTFLLAMQRLTHSAGKRPEGLTFPLLPFPISTRNSSAAIAHLIRASKVQCVYVGDGPMQNILDDAVGQLAEDGLRIKVFRTPTFADLYSPGSHPSIYYDETFPFVPLDTPAIILHSSGSTSFPKPITITHRTLLEMTRSLRYNGMETKGEIMAVHGSPVFHAMGLLALLWSPAHLVVRAVGSPHKVVPPSPEYYISQAVACGATIIYCVPSFVEAWAENQASVRVLQGLKALMFAGAPLSAKAGTLLHSSGVKIRCLLGATEYGQVSAIPAKPHPEGYEWFELSPITSPIFDPQPEENIVEVIFPQTPEHHPAALNTHIDGVPAYASNDLLERHPVNKKLWRVKGRKDDQLMLSTGEKTNPGPLEEIITKNKHVKGSVLFGRGRLQNGVLVEPVSWDDFPTAEEFRDTIWPTVEEANAIAPSHSRIFKEMVLVAFRAKPFSYTLKSTPRRGAIVKDYDPEIEALYNAVKESSQLDIPAPTPSHPDGGWSYDDTVDFVRKVVLRVMKNAKMLGHDDDFFEAGCDSLEATYIRNSILRALRESAPAAQGHRVPANFVYRHPSIHQLGVYVSSVSNLAGTTIGHPPDPEQARANQMDDIVREYTKDFPTHRPSAKEVQSSMGEVVLLTGSTGGLGSQLLAQLAVLSAVSKIYAFNRHKAGVCLRDRQREAFLDRGNDLSILDSGKIVFVEGDSSLGNLGISEGLLHEIRDSITAIIHNAWQVDFKVLLKSFEPAIRGVRNLVDLALHSPHREPPRLLFTSSIGILRNWLPGDFPEAPVDDASLVMNTGYGESKWVSERILLSAAAATPLKPVIVRVGQLAGGLNGCWNIQEWFPSLVRGSQALGCVPDNEGLVSWLPLHAAAAALIDLQHASTPVAHLVHPRPVSWTLVAEHVSHLLDLPLVPYDTWLSKLHEAAMQSSSTEDSRRNPALRLLDFYTACNGSGSDLARREAVGLAMLETKRTVHEAPSLGPDRLPQMSREEVENWISYWRTKGLLLI